jgi:hypothetical protein
VGKGSKNITANQIPQKNVFFERVSETYDQILARNTLSLKHVVAKPEFV